MQVARSGWPAWAVRARLCAGWRGPGLIRALQAAGLDRHLARYPTVAEAVGALTQQAESGNDSAADIVAVAQADLDRIRRSCAAFNERAGRRSDDAAAHAAGARWAEVDRSIGAHLAAMAEICLVTVAGAGLQARQHGRQLISDQQDIRELLHEARLQPAGSPRWWRLVEDTLSSWAQLADRDMPELLADLADRTDASARSRLGRE